MRAGAGQSSLLLAPPFSPYGPLLAESAPLAAPRPVSGSQSAVSGGLCSVHFGSGPSRCTGGLSSLPPKVGPGSERKRRNERRIGFGDAVVVKRVDQEWKLRVGGSRQNRESKVNRRK